MVSSTYVQEKEHELQKLNAARVSVLEVTSRLDQCSSRRLHLGNRSGLVQCTAAECSFPTTLYAKFGALCAVGVLLSAALTTLYAQLGAERGVAFLVATCCAYP